MDQPELPGMPAPAVIEITLRAGLIAGEDHAQWQIETRNPVTGELIAMASNPHFPISALGPEAARMVLRITEAMRAAIDGAGGGPRP